MGGSLLPHLHRNGKSVHQRGVCVTENPFPFGIWMFNALSSERLLMEQLNYNLLFRWFVGMDMDEVVWNHAVFSKNRERLLNEEMAEAFFERVLERARPYMSDEHFTVDGTLI